MFDRHMTHTPYIEKTRFGALDGLRCLAIVAVLFHHSPFRGMLDDSVLIFGRGFLGVDLFFVISGFLITSLLLRERDQTGRISLRGFYWRRALRILPLYYLVVTVVGVYFVVIKQEPGMAEKWLYYYLFLANFLVGDIPTLSPTWSLSVEEQYYLIWPLLLVLLPVRWLLPVLGVVITMNVFGVMGVFGIAAPEIGVLRFALHSATYAPILMGSALAILLHFQKSHRVLAPVLAPRWAGPGMLLVLAVLLVIFPLELTGLPNFAIHLVMCGLVGALVIRETSPLMPLLRWGPVVRIGAVSYGIYLLHLLGLDVALRLTAQVGFLDTPWALNVIYVVVSVLLAELSFRYYETPFLNMRKKYR